MTEAPGPRRIDVHEVLGVLGRGAVGEVLLARTRGPYGFSRLVAIKRLLSTSASDATAVKSLAREALAYARLAHPSIVRLYELVEHDGVPALVLEYVDGVSLKRLTRLLANRSQALSDRSVLYIMSRVFSGLAAAHAARDPETGEVAAVIHRDVSPGNVLISHDGDVKLADFGIARLAGVPSDSVAGALKGTFGYMAPEQVTGAPVTPRTDVYAACLLMRELLARRSAFDDKPDGEVAMLHAMAEPRLTPIATLRPDLPRDLADALTRGLEPRVEQRLISASEIRARIARHLGDPQSAREALGRVVASVHDRHRTRPAEDLEATLPRSIETPALAFPSVHLALDPSPPSEPPPVPSLSPTATSTPPSPRTEPPREIIAAAVIVSVLGISALLITQLTPKVSKLAARAHDMRSSVVVAPAPSASAPYRPPQPAPAIAPSDASSSAPIRPPPARCAIAVTPTRIPHRIFVDHRCVGESGATDTVIELSCRPHRVQVGSRGQEISVTLVAGDDPLVVKAR